jgi:hypothetical protein
MSSFVVLKDGREYHVPREVEVEGGPTIEAWLSQAEGQAVEKEQQADALFAKPRGRGVTRVGS